ncbi:MAG: hypothetical protein QM610_06620 [Chitinophagaceae bacterium]
MKEDITSIGIPPENLTFSLAPLVRYLEEQMASSTDHTQLEQYKKTITEYFPDNDFRILLKDASQYDKLYQYIHDLMTVPLQQNRKHVWGIGLPFCSNLIYGSPELKKLFSNTTGKEFVGIDDFRPNCTLTKDEVSKIMLYAFLVRKLYGIHIFNTPSLIFKTEENGKEKYLQIDANQQFVDISFDGILPKIDSTLVEKENLSKESAMEWLEKAVPIEKIKLEGFVIFEIKDVTEKVMRDHLRNILLASNLSPESQDDITHIVRRLADDDSLDILLLPTLFLNGKVVTNVWQVVSSQIEVLLHKYQIDSSDFNGIVNRYVETPRLIFRENIQQRKEQNEDLAILSASGIMEEIIIKPIFKKNELVGTVIVASSNSGAISNLLLHYLEETQPLLQNLFEHTIGNYLNQLGKVIKTKFTSIQPSVEWKFNDVALQYLNDKLADPHPALLPIRFKHVYPIYGAVDFRNSTIERNHAQVQDWIVQLQTLIATIDNIKKILPVDILQEWQFQAHQWIEILQHEPYSTHIEFSVNQFLEEESLTKLHQLAETDTNITDTIQPYLNGLSAKGLFHRNSNELEKTFKILNANIASILDQMNDKLQEAYPCYFERYRTDGIEFNIYIGQSITPNKPFNPIYLKNVQLWQLNTMALIAKVTANCQLDLPRKILTTQLIFVHSNTITISFRLDERRFDVEDAYNIRYEIVKKRIDKAVVKGTEERLTQPGKIAIVYFQKKDVEDYILHINYLQQMNILDSPIEELELDDMQGVSGLHALRVSVTEQPILETSNPLLLLDSTTTPTIAIAHQKQHS